MNTKSKGQLVCQHLKSVSATEQKWINKCASYSAVCEFVKTRLEKEKRA